MLKVSDELLNDSVFDLEAYISKEFGRRIGTKEEEAFLPGTGRGSLRVSSMRRAERPRVLPRQRQILRLTM